MNKIIRVAQKLLLFNNQNQVLILKAGDNSKTPKDFIGKWDLPGGGLKPSETLFESLQREIKEEIGKISCKIENILDVMEFDYLSHDGNNYQTICLIYKAKYMKGEIMLSSEHQEYQWVNLENILNSNYQWSETNFSFFKKIQKLYKLS